jgi:hypothetical protein
MNQSKFSLADIFNVSGTLVFGFLCFLSFNFLSLGETGASIARAMAFACFLSGFAFGAKLLKRTNRPSKSKIIGEWILLLLFAIIAFVAIFPFSHSFAISEQKTYIQGKLTANIEQASGMFDNYENYAKNRENVYKSRLYSVVNAKEVNPSEYESYGFVSGTDDRIQVENKILTLKLKLYPSNYEEMKQVASTWLIDAKNTITDWKPIGIVDVMNKANSNISSWKDELKQLSTFRAQGETADDFDYPLTFDDITDKIMVLGDPIPFSIIFAIGLYMLMLLSYFITRRHSKNSYTLCSIFIEKKNCTKNDVDIDY